jgi:hypothetical protein
MTARTSSTRLIWASKPLELVMESIIVLLKNVKLRKWFVRKALYQDSVYTLTIADFDIEVMVMLI